MTIDPSKQFAHCAALFNAEIAAVKKSHPSRPTLVHVASTLVDHIPIAVRCRQVAMLVFAATNRSNSRWAIAAAKRKCMFYLVLLVLRPASSPFLSDDVTIVTHFAPSEHGRNSIASTRFSVPHCTIVRTGRGRLNRILAYFICETGR